MSPRLLDQHVAHLRTSGLTDETIAVCKLESADGSRESEARLSSLLWKIPKSANDPWGSGILFPFFRLDGTPMTKLGRRGTAPVWAFRPDTPRKITNPDTGEEHEAKYVRTPGPKRSKGQPGKGDPPYIPPNAIAELTRSDRRWLVITEGEKKGALLAQLGFPAIAVAGVSNMHVPDESDELGRWVIQPAIAELARGCNVLLAWDADAWTNSDVMRAASVAAAMLLDAGARSATLATPPPLAAGGVGPKGFDDLFVARGEDAVHEAIKSCRRELEPAPIEKPKPPWHQRVSRTEDGRILACIGNAVIVLSEHEKIAGRVGFDERRARPVWLRNPPWAGTAREGQPVTDAHVVELAAWMNERVQCAIGTGPLLEALDSVSRRAPFDPVRAYLEGLAWDGVARLDRWLFDFADVNASADARPAELERYVSEVGSRWMISAVARALSPGCKADHMLVLEGAQGVGKSRLLAALVPEVSWFSDHVPDLHDKDARLAVHGPWIVEWSELAALRRSDLETVKAFLTTTHDRFRPPYGRTNVELARRCVFAGSVNPDGAGWLTDPTGARRFWPVVVGCTDAAGLAAARDSLWAEAVARFRRGERWWPEPGDPIAERLASEQEARFAGDPWEERLESLLATVGEIRISDVLERLLGSDRVASAGRGEQMRAAAALKRLGWERVQQRDGSSRRWVYMRPEASS